MALFVPKDRRSLFRQFLGGMYDAVVITDPNGHILDINPRATEHFSYELEDVLDQPVSVLMPGLQVEVVQRIRKGLEGDRHVMINVNGKTKDGAKFACEVTVSMIDLMNPGDLVFTIRNIEKRRAVIKSYQSKVNCFNISSSGLFVCDPEGHFVESNVAFRDMMGLESEEDAKARTFVELMTDDPLPANFTKALNGETTVTGIAAEGENDDQEEIEITLAPNRVGNKIIGVVGCLMMV